ncbi:MAG: hypothetical protein PVG30_00190 [Gammaproteobacteria bacterium]|jgi:hypothetical protein
MSFSQLAADNFYEIFLYFRYDEICNFLTINKEVYTFLMSEFFWEGMCRRDFSAKKLKEQKTDKKEQKTYKGLYKFHLIQTKTGVKQSIDDCRDDCLVMRGINYFAIDQFIKAKKMLQYLLKLTPVIESFKRYGFSLDTKKFAKDIFCCVKFARDHNNNSYTGKDFQRIVDAIQSMEFHKDDEKQLFKNQYLSLLQFAYENHGIPARQERKVVENILLQQQLILTPIKDNSINYCGCCSGMFRFFVDVGKNIIRQVISGSHIGNHL